MSNLAALPALASAATVLFAPHGAVAALARRRAVSRQSLYRQTACVLRAVSGTDTERRLAPLHQRLRQRDDELAHLRRQAQQAQGLDLDRQAEFVATAQALGVSLSATRALLAVFLRERTPSTATLGRRAQAAGKRAAAVLAVLDEPSRARARQVAADEIFAGRRPVLMTVEQDSLCWLGGRLAPSREGTEWAEEFRQLPAARQVSRDGGQGLRKGLELANRRRCQAGLPALADQDDHFHLLQRARRALREVRRQALQAFRRAEEAQRSFDRDGRRGVRRSGGQTRTVGRRWQQAEAAWDRWVAQEGAFERLRLALRPFTPQWELQTRAQAEAAVAAALADLTGPEWTRARRRLVVPETFTFLDRAHEELAALPIPAEVRAALVRAEGLRRQPEALRAEGPHGAALRGIVLVAGVLVASLGEGGKEAVRAVRGVLAGMWRASSLVEGLNSVVRMQQARQKRLTQGLLDLKRLHWNLHVFAAGRRKGTSPYSRLGVALPEGSWWGLLKIPPEQLHQQLSALNPAA